MKKSSFNFENNNYNFDYHQEITTKLHEILSLLNNSTIVNLKTKNNVNFIEHKNNLEKINVAKTEIKPIQTEFDFKNNLMLLNLPINFLVGLKPNTLQLLIRFGNKNNIATIKDLIQLSTRDLYNFTGFNHKNVSEIKNMLKKYNLNFVDRRGKRGKEK